MRLTVGTIIMALILLAGSLLWAGSITGNRQAVADALACGTVLAAGLLCLKTGRSPLRLAIIALLHLRAAWMCAGVAVERGMGTARERYRECYERAVREAGR